MKTNKIYLGDCLDVLKTFPDNCIDSIVTDPPYELGFMGKSWDSTGIANNKRMWAECLRVLKPGGHLLAFGGTRTYHRMAVAIEDAGFEVRDMIEWVYGSGFPKSLNIGKAVDKLQGNEREVVWADRYYDGGTRKEMGMKHHNHTVKVGATANTNYTTKGTSEWEGWGTALKPAHEPICMARKPLAEKTVAENCLKYGTGGINIDESRVGTTGQDKYDLEQRQISKGSGVETNINFTGRDLDLKHGVQELGRFPANLIHDNSEEVRECFPETKSTPRTATIGGTGGVGVSTNFQRGSETSNFNDSGNASRFFKSIIYQAKASKSERNKGCEGMEQQITSDGREKSIDNAFQRGETLRHNNHPTVKPIALMEYLVKMVTPKGGIVLDPFTGSGSTLIACKINGFKYVGIELNQEYIDIAENRLKNVQKKLISQK